ncbi:hypothetical protein MGN70_007653 [Eutypa lata]|nr:hypothetical protein MGN70_007653 [Eutypa lata]
MQLLLRIAATPRNASFARPMALAAFPVAAGIGQQIGFIAIRSALRWSSSNSRWKQRQGGDYYAREAKVKGLKSRAAFKLIEILQKGTDCGGSRLRSGQLVSSKTIYNTPDSRIVLAYQVKIAVERTKPNGRVVGIDLIPAQPPRGVSTIQGNFLSPVVQNLVKEYLAEMAQRQTAGIEALLENADNNNNEIVITDRPSYIDAERAESVVSSEHVYKQISEDEGRLVDVVLSDMSAPWLQTSGFSSNTLSNPYDRMMNTSGMPFRDHAGSIDLCLAALQFASDTLRGGGHFVCKFYQGAEDKDLEKRLKKMFGKVHWEKPDSSRDESREAYFVALYRKTDVWFSDTEP